MGYFAVEIVKNWWSAVGAFSGLFLEFGKKRLGQAKPT